MMFTNLDYKGCLGVVRKWKALALHATENIFDRNLRHGRPCLQGSASDMREDNAVREGQQLRVRGQGFGHSNIQTNGTQLSFLECLDEPLLVYDSSARCVDKNLIDVHNERIRLVCKKKNPSNYHIHIIDT